MTEQFEPELGQLLFSNAPLEEFDMQRHVQLGIEQLGLYLQVTKILKYNPVSNTGAEFSNDVFSIRAYCWCDGDKHPNGCPPNFECGDFKVSWYKYLGRGSSQSRALSTEEWDAIFRKCMDSIKETT